MVLESTSFLDVVLACFPTRVSLV